MVKRSTYLPRENECSRWWNWLCFLAYYSLIIFYIIPQLQIFYYSTYTDSISKISIHRDKHKRQRFTMGNPHGEENPAKTSLLFRITMKSLTTESCGTKMTSKIRHTYRWILHFPKCSEPSDMYCIEVSMTFSFLEIFTTFSVSRLLQHFVKCPFRPEKGHT